MYLCESNPDVVTYRSDGMCGMPNTVRLAGNVSPVKFPYYRIPSTFAHGLSLSALIRMILYSCSQLILAREL